MRSAPTQADLLHSSTVKPVVSYSNYEIRPSFRGKAEKSSEARFKRHFMPRFLTPFEMTPEFYSEICYRLGLTFAKIITVPT